MAEKYFKGNNVELELKDGSKLEGKIREINLKEKKVLINDKYYSPGDFETKVKIEEWDLQIDACVEVSR